MKVQSKILLLTFVLSVFLQTLLNAVTISHIGKQNGLPKDVVNFTVQDKDDYLWIGTHSGLFRFDGVQLTRVKDLALREANVVSGYLDSKGFMWVATYTGEVFVYDGTTFKKCLISNWPNSPVVKIFENSKGHIIVVSKNNGVLEFISRNNYLRFVKTDDEVLIFDAYPLNDRTLIAATDNGLKKVKMQGNMAIVEDKGLFPGIKITDLNKSQRISDILWAATEDNGIFKLKVKNEEIKTISDYRSEINYAKKITKVFEDKEGNMWVGTKESGVFRLMLDTLNGNILHANFFNPFDNRPNANITDIYSDREGNVWVSTFTEGLIKFENEIFPVLFPSNILGGEVLCFKREAKGVFWIGTTNGLYRYKYDGNNKENYGLNKIKTLASDKITCLLLESNYLYVGTEKGGIYKLDLANQRVSKIPTSNSDLSNSIECIHVPSSNQIWIGTLEGIFVYAEGKSTKRYTTSDGLPHNHIKAIHADSKGRIWVGTVGNRISYFDKDHFVVSPAEKVDVSDVSAIYNDENGNSWFATLGHGIFSFDGNKFNQYTTAQGLSENFCYSISVGPLGRTWVSHQQGISRFDPSTRRFTTYTGIYGSTNFEFSVNKIENDGTRMWLCSDRGLMYYSDDADALARKNPKIIINAVKVDSMLFDPRIDIFMSPGQYSLNFQYSGISLKNPTAVKYRFRLMGFDKNWSEESPVKTQIYNSVGHGNYTFQVEACNEFGNWSLSPAMVKIQIQKPFYVELWFIFGCIAVGLLMVYFFINYRTNRLVIEKQKLADIIRERTEELEERNKQILENKDEIEKNATQITDSIKYAKRIQKAIYPSISQFKKLLPESFVFFKSKSIVSGDFYWLEESGSKVLFAACDCTGHGVPGAFISIVTSNLLNQSVKEHGLSKPSLILDEVNKGITQTLHQTYEDAIVKDGMDAALCAYDRTTAVLEYAGAYNSLYLVRRGELTEYKADSIPIGRFIGETFRTFTNNEIIMEDGDIIYIFSDGYADQFGGPEGKKIKKNNFKKILLELSHLPMEEQREKLYNHFKTWQGDLEQVDDVLIIGVKFRI